MGIIKDLWDSCELAKMQNAGPVYLDQWKDDHPQYVKTPRLSDDFNKHKCASRSFEKEIAR